MKLWRYIQGFRKGKEAHRLELESMKDPFLADALDGYDRVKGNHAKRLEQLQKQVSKKAGKKKSGYVRAAAIAASVLLIVGIGSVIMLRENLFPDEVRIAYQDMQPSAPVPVPPEVKPIKKEDAFARTTPPPPEQIAATEAEEAPMELQEVIVTVTDDVRITEDDHATPADTSDNPEIRISDSDRSTMRTAMTGSVSAVSAVSDTLDEGFIARNEEDSFLQEVVVVGYGTKKKASKQAAVTNVPETVDKKGFTKYARENLRRPTDEACKDVKGKVKVSFSINEQGRPYNISIKKSLCPSADTEAIRLLTDGPNWLPNDKEVTIDIKF